MSAMTVMAKPPVNLADKWWTAAHVAEYLHLLNPSAARRWMVRHGVQLCRTDRRLTCQAWVDKALDGRGAK